MPRRKKEWLDEFEFTRIPMDVYKEYDEHRLELVDLLNQLIKDRMIESDGARIISRLDDKDRFLLHKISEAGRLPYTWFLEKENVAFRQVVKKAKARSLVIPIKKGKNTYYYDLTDFGQEVVNTLKQMQSN